MVNITGICKYTLGFHDISKVVKNWKFFNSDGIEKFSSMENYDFQTNKWGKTNKIIGDYSLFKIYEFNEYFYSYLFKYRNKYYKISSRETEKIRLIIISKSNKNLIKYDQKNNEIIFENKPLKLTKTEFEILKYLEDYKTELIHDTLLIWGLIYHDNENLTEIYVDESKYLKYWGNNEEKFRNIMNQFNLSEIENLEFIDEYPKVRENINLHFENITETGELIETLRQTYVI